MKHTVILSFVTIMFLSCKKNNTPAANNNEIIADVVVASGGSYHFDAKGNNALYLQHAGGNNHSTIVSGSDAKATIELDFADISDTGAYPYIFTFDPDHSDGTGPVYLNNTGVSNPGVLRVTTLTGKHVEGSFTGTGKENLGATDSVSIQGTFKGDFQSP